MQELSPIDLNWLVQKLPKNLLYQLTHTDKKYVIAGGFVRAGIAKEKINDIDIFASTKEDAEALADKLQPSREKIFVTENAFSFTVQGRAVQVIHRWTFENPAAIMMHFDFTVVQACIWYDKSTKTWQSMCGSNFYSDLAAKRLVYTYPDDAEPGSSLLRVLKYKGRGYNPVPQTLAEIVARTAGVDFDTVFNKLKEIDPRISDSPVNKYSSKAELTEAAIEPINKIITGIAGLEIG